MTVTLDIGAAFSARLSKICSADVDADSPVGWLIGTYDPHNTARVVLINTMAILDNTGRREGWLHDDAEEASSILPPGLSLVGAIVRGETTAPGVEAVAAAVAKAVQATHKGFSPAARPLLLSFFNAKGTFFGTWGNGTLDLLDATLPPPPTGDDPQAKSPGPSQLDPWLEQHCTAVRCTADVTLQVVGARPAGNADPKAQPMFPMAQALEHACRDLGDRMCGEDTAPPSFIAQPLGSGPLLLEGGGQYDVAALGGSAACPLLVSPVRAAAAPSDGSCPAPSCAYQPLKGGPASLDTAPLHLDLLCYVTRGDIPGSDLASQIRQGLRAQLTAMQRLLTAKGAPSPLQALHFQPPTLPHPVTLLYPLPCDIPAGAEDTPELVSLRQRLHARLGLPPDRPLLRAALALRFDGAPADPGKGGRLADVHVGLAPSGVSGGQVHVIHGHYDYFHYMQDKFDDNGWGCAYRSLQTICSWFRRQHYTAAPVPSHREIQQTLVKIGDKDAAFVGSRNWIGAIELGYVLDTLLEVSSKYITVSSGAEMPSKAREIAHHFDTQGTPIMIGGGVLAYTLLGIDLNDRTGECAFLILDPHYTGADELSRIHSGQWVAWKRADGKAAAGGDLFVQDAFYNLLCPQRPKKV